MLGKVTFNFIHYCKHWSPGLFFIYIKDFYEKANQINFDKGRVKKNKKNYGKFHILGGGVSEGYFPVSIFLVPNRLKINFRH